MPILLIPIPPVCINMIMIIPKQLFHTHTTHFHTSRIRKFIYAYARAAACGTHQGAMRLFKNEPGWNQHSLCQYNLSVIPIPTFTLSATRSYPYCPYLIPHLCGCSSLDHDLGPYSLHLNRRHVLAGGLAIGMVTHIFV